MSEETDSFMHEVSEEVRRDRLYAFLRKWGWLIGLVLVLIVGGAGANEWLKYRAETEAQAAGDALRVAMEVEDPAERAAQIAEFANANPSAAGFARIAQAGSLVQAGDEAGAAEVLAAVSVDPEVSPILQSVASLRRVMLMGSELPSSERLAILQGLTDPNAPFRPLALEQRALYYLEEGDSAAAIPDLELILEEPGATQALMDRARQLIVAAGGAVPVSGGPGGLTVPEG
ncbi:tetratricopeptide repeat protein [Amaricoccus tamworthensis]|uniref:tetratricopeptide repeat protein n=1 Tax=Amaricoccus tamworthensis TaxID=57002 RepID=UPI003C7AD306